MDELDDFENYEEVDDFSSNEEVNEQSNDDELIFNMLKSQGIEDPTKIKFEDDYGNIQEKNWESLSMEEKQNILNTNSQYDEDYDLDDSEVELINAIRNSNLTPAEYLQAVSNQSVQRYVTNSQQQSYSVDELNDDELYVLDLLSKADNLTDDEAADLLIKARENQGAYQKQVDALRNSYREKENDYMRQQQAAAQQKQQEAYYNFANSIKDSINNLTEISGYGINLDDDEKDNIFEFVTGFDNAGNSWFGKALNNPETVTNIAYYLLYGDTMLDEINSYYQDQIKQVRQNSYNKGVQDGQNGTQVIYKPKQMNQDNEDYIDDF